MIVALLAALAVAAPDPDWPYPPAWEGSVATVPRKLPMGVCPYGVTGHAAYRAGRRLDRFVIVTPARWLVNTYRLRVRVYVWCG